MRLDKATAFDRNYEDKPLIKMLLHVDSFINEIISDEKTITSLLELSKYPIIHIIAMPTADGRIIKLLNEKGINLSSYVVNDDHVILEYKVYNNYIPQVTDKIYKLVLSGKYQDLEEPLVKGSAIKKIDYLVGRNKDFDYFVANTKDTYYYSEFMKNRDICPEHAIELIRILLVNLGYFYVKPNLSVSEGYYYLYRFKKIFYEYQLSASVIMLTQGKSTSEEVYNQFDSLSTRLQFLCRAADKTSYYALKGPSNSSQNNALYHFGYYIMLITGIFDDLAWIINELYSFQLDKMEVSIKKAPNRQTTKFYNLLKLKNNELYGYLINEETQKKILMFYPIRDSLQHRQFIKGIRYKNISKDFDKNLFEISSTAIDAIKKVFLVDGKEMGLVFSSFEDQIIEPHAFTLRSLEYVSEIVNNTLRLIDWEQFIKVLSEEDKSLFYDAKKQYEKGLGNFLGWGAEPLYF